MGKVKVNVIIFGWKGTDISCPKNRNRATWYFLLRAMEMNFFENICICIYKHVFKCKEKSDQQGTLETELLSDGNKTNMIIHMYTNISYIINSKNARMCSIGTISSFKAIFCNKIHEPNGRTQT